jgi:hypothetical protein
MADDLFVKCDLEKPLSSVVFVQVSQQDKHGYETVTQKNETPLRASVDGNFDRYEFEIHMFVLRAMRAIILDSASPGGACIIPGPWPMRIIAMVTTLKRIVETSGSFM